MPRPNRFVLDHWVVDALTSLGGRAGIVDTCKWIWDHHERDRTAQGICSTRGTTTFAGWPTLRRERKLKAASISPQGVWELRP